MVLSETHFPAYFVEMPEGVSNFRRAAFYLAAEEHIARNFPLGNYLFTWRLRPTVVIGRNQAAHQEVDLDFCKSRGIDVIRRKSGGGAIFADERNIMISLITGAGPVEPLFKEYAESVSRCLTELGAPTTVSGRNDILLEGGGKVCGNAFYHLADRNIVHGTMLYDTNPEWMQGALLPDVAKLRSAGVKSVRSRVALLKDFLPFGVERLQEELRKQLTHITVSLEDEDILAIEEIEQTYYSPAYLLDSHAHAELSRGGRVEGCGTLELLLLLRGSVIRSIELRGDYFELADAGAAFRDAFIGVTFTPQNLQTAIAGKHPERSIRGLDAEQLLRLFSIERTN